MAGGRSSRIGSDKGQLTLGGKKLSQRTADFIDAIFKQVIYVTNSPEMAPRADSITVVTDEIPYLGPLGGISAGLSVSKNKKNFIVAFDMPFLNEELIRHMIGMADEADIVVPKLKGGYEPLHAVYSIDCLMTIDKKLKEGEYKAISFFKEHRIKEIDETELRRYDPDLLSFFNINTWDDYEKAKKIIEG